MADKSFGVKELNLLNASGTPTVTSPNNLNLNANTVAISTSVTVGQNLTVSANAGIASLNVTGIATVVNFNATGISTIAQPADSNPMANWTITNNSSSAYRFTGPGQSGSDDNPDLYLVRGHRYIFKHNATSSHPIQIRFANGGSAYTDGVTYSDTGNNRTTDGNNLILNVQHDAPAQLYYQCTNHGSMVGNIYVVGGPQVISGVTTFSNGINVSGGTLDVATSLRKSSGTLDYLAATHTFANVAGSTEYFRFASSGQLGIAGANYGTSGRVLTSAGPGSAVTWSAIPARATIANNADNRVITGGSGVNLNGESNLFFNGSQLGVNVTPDSGVHLHVQNSGEANMILEGDVNGVGGYLMLKNNNTTANTSMAIQFLDAGGQGTSEIKGIYADNSNNEGHLTFSTRPSGGSTTERLRIDSSGRLLVGRTSGTGALLQVDEGAQVYGAANDGNSSCLTMDYSSSTGRIMGHGSSGGTLSFFTNFSSNGVQESMRLNNIDQQTAPVLRLFKPRAASNVQSHMIHFLVSGGHERGAIAAGSSFGSSPSFTSISDYRVKTNIRNYTGGWDNIKALPVKLFDINKEGEESKDIKGWIAHEVQAVIPEAVVGTKDAKKADGSDDYQSLGYNVFMPDVVSALQKAITKIETLEAKVAALEGS